jgi:hypothetical protein
MASAVGRLALVCLIVGGALVSTDREAAAACPPGQAVDSTGVGCILPGYFDCGGGRTCRAGATCGPNGTCLDPAPAGPMCNGLRCPAADQLCNPSTGTCYSPKTQFLCGAYTCGRSIKYEASSPCACRNREAAPKHPPPDGTKNAVDTKKKEQETFVTAAEDAAKDASGEWSCAGLPGFPIGPITNPSRFQKSSWHFCIPAGSTPCSTASRSYSCPGGWICNGDGTTEPACRKNVR